MVCALQPIVDVLCMVCTVYGVCSATNCGCIVYGVYSIWCVLCNQLWMYCTACDMYIQCLVCALFLLNVSLLLCTHTIRGQDVICINAIFECLLYTVCTVLHN